MVAVVARKREDKKKTGVAVLGEAVNHWPRITAAAYGLANIQRQQRRVDQQRGTNNNESRQKGGTSTEQTTADSKNNPTKVPVFSEGHKANTDQQPLASLLERIDKAKFNGRLAQYRVGGALALLELDGKRLIVVTGERPEVLFETPLINRAAIKRLRSIKLEYAEATIDVRGRQLLELGDGIEF